MFVIWFVLFLMLGLMVLNPFIISERNVLTIVVKLILKFFTSFVRAILTQVC